MQDDESVLIRRSQEKDADAFAELYRRHFDNVYRYVAFQLGNSSEAEDITAEVFLRAYRAIGGYKARGVPLSAWLFRIAHNCVIDYRRRLRPSVPLDMVSELCDKSKPNELLEERLAREELSSALQQLTEAQRQVLALKFGAGLCNAEVARVMGKSEGAIKALQHAGLESLRRKLGGAWEAR